MNPSGRVRATARLPPKPARADAPAQKPSPKAKRLSYKEQQEFDGMEAAILAAEEELADAGTNLFERLHRFRLAILDEQQVNPALRFDERLCARLLTPYRSLTTPLSHATRRGLSGLYPAPEQPQVRRPC